MEETSKSMTSSEEANMEDDGLSLLPANLRFHIMSIVPIHEAFKTSLLSRMWSAVWLSLHVLIFYYRIFPEVDED